MYRKGMVLALGAIAAALGAFGFAPAADDEKSPLHEIMETVNKRNGEIRKGVNSATAFNRADKKALTTKAEELVKLAKEAKPHNDAAKKVKRPVEEWNKSMDIFIAGAEDLAKILGKKDAKQPDAKKSFTSLQKACSDCHTVFRPEEEG